MFSIEEMEAREKIVKSFKDLLLCLISFLF